MRSRITWAALWLAGAVLAAAGITVTVSLLGTDLLGPASPVLSAAQVRQQLASQPAAPAPAPAGSAQSGSAQPGSAQPGGPATRASFSTAAGMVSASCSGGLARLTSWTITTPGYRTDGYLQGPAPSAWITFKSGAREQTVTVTCRGGRPHHVISNDDRAARPGSGSGTPASSPAGPGGDDHGGGSGGGGGRGRGGGTGGHGGGDG
jgi:hypothetical protein